MTRLTNRTVSIAIGAVALAAGIAYLVLPRFTVKVESQPAPPVADTSLPMGTRLGNEVPAPMQQALLQMDTMTSYTATSTAKTKSGATMITERLIHNSPDGQLRRSQIFTQWDPSKGPSKKAPFSAVILDNPDGHWQLFAGVAIKAPSRSAQLAAAENAVLDSGAQAGALPSYWSEPGGNEVPSATVLYTRVEDEGTTFQRVDFIRKLIEQRIKAGVQQARQLSAAAFVPRRTQYWVAADRNFLLRKRVLSAQGNIMSDVHYSQTDDVPTAQLFTVPAGVALLFPKTEREFAELVLKHSRPGLEVTKQKTKQQ